MRCPRLHELPPPPPGKTGWPWTEESEQLPDKMPDGREWPCITIITPSYNRAETFEECIRSILLQGYPDLEYIVIDGGSRDETLSIIRKYEPWLAEWVSEPDGGTSEAVNQGLKRATGDLWGTVSTDDYLSAGSLSRIAQLHARFPSSLIAGDVVALHEHTGASHLYNQRDIDLRNIVELWTQRASIHNAGLFYPRSILSQIGLLDESLKYCNDHDFLCRALTIADVKYLKLPVITFRIHDSSLTGASEALPKLYVEASQVSQRYWHLVRNVDVRGYKRRAAEIFFCMGVQMLLQRRPSAVHFMAMGLRESPYWAFKKAFMLFPAWIRKKCSLALRLSTGCSGRVKTV